MRNIFLTVALLFLTACVGEPIGQSNSIVTASSTDVAAIENVEYRLGSGDKIRLNVFGEEMLSGEFAVDGSGMVSLPLVGEVEASGQTVREFQKTVEAVLRDGYLNDPRVSAEVANFRPYYILGEVNKPGTYPYSDGLTVMNAVAVAEGFSYRANQKMVFIRRDGEEKEVQYPLTSTTRVRPGDTVRIAERLF